MDAWLSLALMMVLTVLLLPAEQAASRTARRISQGRARHALEVYLPHFRSVLYEHGLLALVLDNDPLQQIPSLGRLGALPASEVLGRRNFSGGSSLAGRLDVLVEFYAPICRHYGIEPYPQGSGGWRGLTDHVRLRGLAYHAFMLALAEGVLGDETEAAKGGTMPAHPTR